MNAASKITLETKPLAKVSRRELKRLKELTLTSKELDDGLCSNMRAALKITKVKTKQVVIARDEENKIVGWALLHKFLLGFVYKGKIYKRKNRITKYAIDLNVYVDPKNRRQGIGKKLVSKAKKLKIELWPGIRLLVYPWNIGSVKFYKACKMKG